MLQSKADFSSVGDHGYEFGGCVWQIRGRSATSTLFLPDAGRVHRVRPLWIPLLACLLSPFFCASVTYGQTLISEVELSRRRAEISSLSDPDRAELTRKYQDFQKLTSAEQEYFRKLHQEVEGNPALKSAMERYCDWLKDLDVAQREQLRAADTPEKKRLAVVRIRQEQKLQQEDQLRSLESREVAGKMGFSQLASSDDLKKIMGSLEACLAKVPQTDPAQLAKVKQLNGTLRYERLLWLLSEVRHPKDGAPYPEPHWLDDFKMTVGEVMPNQLRQSFDLRLGDRSGPPPRGFVWLMMSLLEEGRREFSATAGDDLRESLFRALTPQKQSDFLQTPPESQPLFLKRMHLDELRRAFLAAFDLPRPPGEGRGDGRGEGPGRGEGRDGFGRGGLRGGRSDGPPPLEVPPGAGPAGDRPPNDRPPKERLGREPRSGDNPPRNND